MELREAAAAFEARVERKAKAGTIDYYLASSSLSHGMHPQGTWRP